MAKGLLPCLAMVTIQTILAAMNITTKLALDSGLSPFVFVTYRQIIATIVVAPFACFLERKMRPRITKKILFQLFLSSILGATLSQGLFFLGLKHTSPTIACALANLSPAFTFVMAVIFRTENLDIKLRAGQAKVLGTILCVGGAILMSFYQGKTVNTWQWGLHWKYIKNVSTRSTTSNTSNNTNFLGPVLVIGGCFSWSLWFIVQAEMNKTFEAPYWSTMMMTFMASLECGVLTGAFFEHHLKRWLRLTNISVIAILFSGVIGSGLALYLISWCIQRKGPLYASAFGPLTLVIVAIFQWVLCGEKLHVGSLLGSGIIVVGLYIVLWGKEREMITETNDSAVIKSKNRGETEMP